MASSGDDDAAFHAGIEPPRMLANVPSATTANGNIGDMTIAQS